MTGGEQEDQQHEEEPAMAPAGPAFEEEEPYMDGGDLGDEEGPQQSEPLFSCRIDNAKVVTATLASLSTGAKKDQYAQVEANQDGLVIIVTGRAKFTQSQGTINASLFQAYQCREGGGNFTVDLPLLLECLQVFGAASLQNTMLTMAYEPARAVLQLTLEEQGVLTTCEINALEDVEDAHDIAFLATEFRACPEVFRVIVKSEVLREAISDLADLPGASTVRVTISPEDFHLASGGTFGSLDLFLPRTSEAFIHFECTEPGSWCYSLAALNHGMRALAVAKETYVRVNEAGIMCVQHQVENNVRGQSTFIDFLCLCEEEEEEDADYEPEPEAEEEGRGRHGE